MLKTFAYLYDWLILQVTNQLVMACKEYIKNCTLTMEDEDKLWDRIQEEIEHRDTSCLEVDPKIKLLKSQVESKLKVSHHLQSLTLFILGTSTQVLWQTLKTQVKCCIRVCTVC